MTTAIYVRTSTEDNDGASQLATCREYVARNMPGGASEYVETGIGAAKQRRGERPEWNRLMRDCRAGQVSTVVATEVSRIGRLGAGQVLQAFDELHRLGVRLVLVRQGLDAATTTGRLVLAILAEVAAYERALLLERSRAGIDKAQRDGVRFGRPERSFDAERAARMRSEGASWRVVAQAVGAPMATVRRKLRALAG
jgi:putative DNA-invertase from lambdoid prophage Rac